MGGPKRRDESCSPRDLKRLQKLVVLSPQRATVTSITLPPPPPCNLPPVSAQRSSGWVGRGTVAK